MGGVAPVCSRSTDAEALVFGAKGVSGSCMGAFTSDIIAGLVWAAGGRPRVVFAFTIARGKIVAIDLLADPERLRQLDLTVLNR